MSKKWSNGEVTALTFMWRVAGMPSRDIAAILNRTRDSVIGKIARLGMCEQGRFAPGGGAPKWAPFKNPRYPLEPPEAKPEKKVGGGLCRTPEQAP